MTRLQNLIEETPRVYHPLDFKDISPYRIVDLSKGKLNVQLLYVPYHGTGVVDGADIKKGMMLACVYTINRGLSAFFVEVLGATVEDDELSPEFDDIKTALSAHDCETLYDASHKHQLNLKLVVQMLDHDEPLDSGALIYLRNGYFCIGSMHSHVVKFLKLAKS